MQLPETDRYSMDKGRLLSTIAVLFGGRIAEEIFMDQMTTGASNDFERATAIARDIVTRYGMTDELGPMVYAENEGEVFLAAASPRPRTCPKPPCRRWTPRSAASSTSSTASRARSWKTTATRSK